MIQSLYHAEIGGGYTMRRKVTINAADLRPFGGQIEVAAIDAAGDELFMTAVSTEAEALGAFNQLVQQYAEPFQKAITAAGLVPGHRYTLVHLGEFGFPIVEKITYHGMTLTTYAQHADVVRLIYTPFRCNSKRSRLFFGSSMLIFDGWQDLPRSVTEETLRDDAQVKITRSKYSCFSAHYIEDAAALLKNPVLIYKAYKTGTDGKIYACITGGIEYAILHNR